jgi:Asp-tRNA(Asn)/Glu-tRNA(Gln) amidotransferase A subunit family amidase
MDATIEGIHAAMKSGSLSCVALVQGYLARIKAYDQAGPKLNAIQNVNPAAVAIAGDLDGKLKSGGPLGRLHCIPVLVKDQVETNFMPATYGSALFKTFVPARNATIVEKMLYARARASGCALHRPRRVFQQQARSICALGGALRHSYGPE